jgi:hypothetical protein
MGINFALKKISRSMDTLYDAPPFSNLFTRF